MKKLAAILLLISADALATQRNLVKVTTTHIIGNSEEVTLLQGTGFYNVTMPSCSSTNDGEVHYVRNNSGNDQCPNVCPASGEKMEGTVNSCWGICNFQADNFVCEGAENNWVGLSYWN